MTYIGIRQCVKNIVKLDQENEFCLIALQFDVLEKEKKEKIKNKNIFSFNQEDGKGGYYLEKEDIWFAEGN